MVVNQDKSSLGSTYQKSSRAFHFLFYYFSNNLTLSELMVNPTRAMEQMCMAQHVKVLSKVRLCNMACGSMTQWAFMRDGGHDWRSSLSSKRSCGWQRCLVINCTLRQIIVFSTITATEMTCKCGTLHNPWKKKKFLMNNNIKTDKQQRLWPWLENHVGVHKGLLIPNYFSCASSMVLEVLSLLCRKSHVSSVNKGVALLFTFFLFLSLLDIRQGIGKWNMIQPSPRNCEHRL